MMLKITEIEIFDSESLFSIVIRKDEISIFDGEEWLLSLSDSNNVVLPETKLRKFKELRNVAVELFRLSQELRSFKIGIKQIVRTVIRNGADVETVDGLTYRVDESVANVVYLLLCDIKSAMLSLEFNDHYVMSCGIVYKVSVASARVIDEGYLSYLEARYGVYIAYDAERNIAFVYRTCEIEKDGNLMIIKTIGGKISEPVIDTLRKNILLRKLTCKSSSSSSLLDEVQETVHRNCQ